MAGVLCGDSQLHVGNASSWVFFGSFWHSLLPIGETGISQNQLAKPLNSFWFCAARLFQWWMFFLYMSDWVTLVLIFVVNSLMGDVQLSLALVFILKARTSDFISWFGIKCSSFTGVNRGTSKRSASNSTGDSNMPSVRESNALLERIEIFGFQQTFVFMQKFHKLQRVCRHPQTNPTI